MARLAFVTSDDTTDYIVTLLKPQILLSLWSTMFSKVRKIFTGVPLFRRVLIINSRSLIVMASNWQSAHMKQKEQW